MCRRVEIGRVNCLTKCVCAACARSDLHGAPRDPSRCPRKPCRLHLRPGSTPPGILRLPLFGRRAPTRQAASSTHRPGVHTPRTLGPRRSGATMTARSERTTERTDAHGRVTPVTETGKPTPRTKRTTATSAPSTLSTPRTRQRQQQSGARRTDTSGSTTVGKTRWERMSKSDLTLARLGELLAHEKAAANASPQTLRWYRGTLRRYSEWLAS